MTRSQHRLVRRVTALSPETQPLGKRAIAVIATVPKQGAVVTSPTDSSSLPALGTGHNIYYQGNTNPAPVGTGLLSRPKWVGIENQTSWMDSVSWRRYGKQTATGRGTLHWFPAGSYPLGPARSARVKLRAWSAFTIASTAPSIPVKPGRVFSKFRMAHRRLPSRLTGTRHLVAWWSEGGACALRYESERYRVRKLSAPGKRGSTCAYIKNGTLIPRPISNL